MKVNKIFHWLYFLMLLLPIFVIPMFALMVRSDNGWEPISITVGENVTETLHFNQLIENGKPTSIDYYEPLTMEDVYCINNKLQVPYPNEEEHEMFSYRQYYDNADEPIKYHFYKYHTYYFFITIANDPLSTYSEVGINFKAYYGNSFYHVLDTLTEGHDYDENDNEIPNRFTYKFVPTQTYTIEHFYFEFDLYGEFTGNFYFYDMMLIDFTQLYGFEKEKSVSDFRVDFPNEYYNFTWDTPYDVVVSDTTLVYDDTDIGSQFVYSTYKVIDEYFNYDNVFNFGDLYNWLQLNFFNGNAPLGFFIFWHYLIYFLLTSLLWLLFDVLMYVPKLIHRWLDKADIA